MKKSLNFFLPVLLSITIGYGNAQDLKTNSKGKKILEKTIKYHDLQGVWDKYKGKLFEITVFASNNVVKEIIEIDRPNDFYLSTCFQDFGTLKRGIIILPKI